MNIKRSLISLFVLLFLLSGIGLGLLVLDDQKDLSSRAATGITSNLLPALSEVKPSSDATLWDGSALNIPIKISYNNNLWAAPTTTDPVFVYQTVPATVRLVNGQVNLIELQKILGDFFVSPKAVGTPKVYLQGWFTQSYTFMFFGSEKFVDVWYSDLGLSLIAVMPDESPRDDVQAFAKGISASSQVKGLSTPDDSGRLAAVTRPSVVMILNKYCAQMKFTSVAGPLLADKNYPFCYTQTGTGFFINKDGYVATNGHVITNLPENTVTYAISGGSLDGLLVDYFYSKVVSQTTAPVDRKPFEDQVINAHRNQETLYQMAGAINELLKSGALKIESPDNKFFVQLGNTPFQLQKSEMVLRDDIITAKFIAADYEIPDPVKGFNSSDVGIIKVDGTGYPALPLGNINDLEIGSQLLVIGFPSISMGKSGILLDTSANAQPTFTRGVVSAIKQTKGDKKNLIQTDASTNHGNSGGPAVDSSGRVVGITTYGVNSEDMSGGYGFLRDVADLRALMIKNNIAEDTSETYLARKRGLDNYWLSYFKFAKADFEKVVSLYKVHPTVNKYLTETNPKIGTVEDKTPKFSHSERQIYMGVSGGIMAFSIFAIMILSILEYFDSRRRQQIIIPPRQNIPPRPLQTF